MDADMTSPDYTSGGTRRNANTAPDRLRNLRPLPPEPYDPSFLSNDELDQRIADLTPARTTAPRVVPPPVELPRERPPLREGLAGIIPFDPVAPDHDFDYRVVVHGYTQTGFLPNSPQGLNHYRRNESGSVLRAKRVG